MNTANILIAGIGNVFHGDDGFGVAVAHALQQRPLPPQARVVDFGIRGLDLAYALLDPYDLIILVDAAQRGYSPGTVFVIEPSVEDELTPARDAQEGHGMGPARAISMARCMGARVNHVRLVSCEPLTFEMNEEGFSLSAPVQAAVDEAVTLIESLVQTFLWERGNQDGADAVPRTIRT